MQNMFCRNQRCRELNPQKCLITCRKKENKYKSKISKNANKPIRSIY